ncbi:MAG: TonB-dependent receptor [Bacteroidales bacterium]|nr:TonB-dependent receptor [Bacteroidales bacterium]
MKYFENQKQNCSSKRKPKFLNVAIICLLAMLAGILGTQAQSITDSLQPIQLEGVGISWSKASGEEMFSATSINKDEINSNMGNGSINNLFELVPSMITTSDAGTGIGYTYMRIRGIDQTRINVTINGIALNDAESQGSWFVNLPDFGSKVQHLDVQRGVGTSNNGSAAFGATMDFSTLDNVHQRFFEVSSVAGSFNTFRNSITVGTGLIGDCFAATLSYSNVLSDGYINYSNAKLHNLFFSSDFYLKNKKKNKDYGKLKLNIIYGNEKTGLAWNGVPSSMLENDRRYNSCGEYTDPTGQTKHYFNETDNYQQLHTQLFYDYNKRISDRNHIKVNVAGHFTRSIGYYEEYKADKKYSKYALDNPSFSHDHILTYDTINSIHEATAIDTIIRDTLTFNNNVKKGDFITQKWLDNYFYGVTFSFKQSFTQVGNKGLDNRLSWSVGGSANRYDGKHYGIVKWAQFGGVPDNYHWYDGTGKKNQFNIYGTLDYSQGRWYTYIDLQYRMIDYHIGGIDDDLTDVTQNYLWHFFNPKAGVSVDLDQNRHHSLYLSLARSQREPTRSDLIDGPADKKPVPETLYDVELGYRMQYNKYAFNANAYFMYYDKQLVLTGEINDVGAAIMTNVDKSYRLGIELVSAYKPIKYFTWNIKGTFSLNKILDYTEYVDDWDNGGQVVKHLGTTDISFSPNIVASNEFIVTPVDNFNISLTTQFVSRQFIDNSSNKQYSIKPYCVTNLNLSYCFHTKPVKDIELFFRINNLFNAKYESNAWVYRYYYEGAECYMDGYFPQATINFMGGVRLKFSK